MTRNQRIKKALEDSGITYDKLGEKLGVKKAAISDRLNREKEIDSMDFIDAVVELTGASKEYILLDAKPYSLSGNSVRTIEDSKTRYSISDYKNLYESLLIKYESLERELKTKDELIKTLKEQLEDKEKRIQLMVELARKGMSL